MEEIKYITPEEAGFYRNKGGFLGLKIWDKEYGRVSLHRAFPFSYTKNFISVRDKDSKEIGLIEDMNKFQRETIEMLEEELNRRYFLPAISRINSIKEEFGYSYWNVETDIGPKRFTIKKYNSSFVNVKENRILVVDIDGNRYEISDYTKLDPKSYKLIEMLL